ncbi:UDP-N-acetylglucosamine 2-epimerase [Marinomonas primoryensis]|uniref:UDP-N-acetylglucosamine 2-epimerase n=1 Tax=Marinomonas primoryensis TaxID=178399 RepID=A0A2Z4PU58_9GAMM|nr:UDP-N-acetylglucosamine 2-epimerase (non-hydrolyzing) [Marinomonas primoryensis]AWY01066.1 UDP-N-acetylglucosamine 2-epimerase [Marinomonas primoryensis]AWY02121.1 UDP-N-acetylglucosamine 2-epimerase [Marinomonas primoryensis]
MKVLTVVGARPQFVKAGTISREIKSRNGIDEIIVHTGQHYDANMSDVFFEEMQIPKPNYFLGVGAKSHGEMTGQMIEKIEAVLVKEKPDFLIVYGDTNSTLAGAVAASKLHIKIAHIEAGLRSFNSKMPEETNRIITDRISSYLFCPTQTAIDNLKNEGFNHWKTNSKLILSGDVMQDGALFYSKLAEKPKHIALERMFILCTIHRAENTDDPKRLTAIIAALNFIAQKQQIILPLHPRTKKILDAGAYDISNITIIEPVGYLNMVWLIDNCSMVMTDSGGLQKEAYFFAKPCITIRDETEWVELVENNVNFLTDCESIINTYEKVSKIEMSEKFKTRLYGDGNAASIIVDNLMGI